MTDLGKTAVSLAAVMGAGAAHAGEPAPVSFESHGETLQGALYLPDDYEGRSAVNAVVVTGAWTSVKEQMPAVYAQALAARGYAALTFDFRGWGESQGEPRQLEDPRRKTEDIVAAARHLASLPQVNEVGGLGICASAGYMVAAANRSDDIDSVGLVAPWLHDADIVETVYGGPRTVAGLIETGRAAARTYAETGEAQMIPAASTTDETALMFAAPYYTEPDRGLIPAYVNAFNLASWEPWLTFDAVAEADALSTPLTFVHSDAAAIPQGARAFEARAGGRARGVWLEDISQFDFYDRPDPVARASEIIADHFDETL